MGSEPDSSMTEAGTRKGREHVPPGASPDVGMPPESPDPPQSQRPHAAREQPAPPQTSKKDVSVRVEEASLSDFEAMMAESGDVPDQRAFDVGDKVEGRVMSIGEAWIYVDLGGSTEGLARRRVYEDDDGNLTLKVGDAHTFYVTSIEDGTIMLGHQLGTREASLDAIRAAHATGAPIEGRVAATNKGGFDVVVGGINAFCPISQIELGYCEEPDVHIGNTYRFRVIEIREDGRTVVVGRSDLLAEEAEEAAKRLMERIGEGQVVRGKVTRVTDFGAFVDLGGVEGLVHVSELGYGHVDDPSEVVSEGDEVEVEILRVEETDRGPRIGLSMKATMTDPWSEVAEKLHEGQRLTGTVVRLESFGAFVEVLPGIEGLVHVSEMSWEKHVKRPSDVVSVGEQIVVEVQSIDLVNRRISLSMKAAEGDPWHEVTDRYEVGMEVEGVVENVEDFGAFVRLGSGVTALLHKSEMNLPQGATPLRRYQPGQEVTARVLGIEPKRRRMSLTTRSAEDIAAEADRANAPTSYSDASDEGGSFGTLGDLLKDKLDE